MAELKPNLGVKVQNNSPKMISLTEHEYKLYLDWLNIRSMLKKEIIIALTEAGRKRALIQDTIDSLTAENAKLESAEAVLITNINTIALTLASNLGLTLESD